MTKTRRIVQMEAGILMSDVTGWYKNLRCNGLMQTITVLEKERIFNW